jgi:hypothetical protein
MPAAIPTTSKHAVYVICETRHGTLSFRVGQPVSWDRAQARWQRIADRLDGFNGQAKRRITVRHDGRRYCVRSMCVEVRAVDAHGRGLGSERHTLAFPVPYRALSTAKGR